MLNCMHSHKSKLQDRINVIIKNTIPQLRFNAIMA